MDKTPGMVKWLEGGTTRAEMERINRAAGLPCYCSGIWSGYCDFCTGLAPKGGDRWTGQLAEQSKGRETLDVSTIYAAAKEQGIETDSHESDLYLKDSPITKALLGVAHVNAKSFRHQVDGSLWWEIPFAFSPFWDKVSHRAGR